MMQVDQALERLIQQFAQPLAFLRELIQNSLDAGTESVELEVGYDREGRCCVITVSDTGEGMTREVIDMKLTRLFSSSKEDDLTKIGKFGIGFVSIFAMDPALVVLETGRQGEYWRVLFQPDRSFERLRMEIPVEGTKVKLYTRLGRDKLKKLIADCRDTVEYWCKHCHVEIVLNGEPINRPFGLDDPLFEYRYRNDATEAVLGVTEGQSTFGYFNRGLTLLEGNGSPIEGVSFKVRSVHLEHTLTRDNVLHDDGYLKLMDELTRVSHKEMPTALFSELERSSQPELWRAAQTVWTYPDQPSRGLRRAQVFPTRQGRVSFDDLPSTVYFPGDDEELRAAVEEEGFTVLDLPDATHPCFDFLKDRSVAVHSMIGGFVWLDYHEPERGEEQGLFEDLHRLLRRPFSSVQLRLATVRQSPSTWKPKPILLAPEGRSVFPCVSGFLQTGGGDTVVLLTDQLLWRTALALWEAQPELALATLVAAERLESTGRTQLPKGTLERLLRELKQKGTAS